MRGAVCIRAVRRVWNRTRGTAALRPLVVEPLVGVDLSPKMDELDVELVPDDSVVTLAKERMRRCSGKAHLALVSEAPLLRLYEVVFTADLLHLLDTNLFDGFGHEVRDTPPELDLIVSNIY